MTLLQAAELTKEGARAAATVTDQMSQLGPLYAFMWLLIVVLVGIAFFMFWKYDKLRSTYNADVAKAREETRTECARQQAIDNGHYEDLLKESREREREAINRLDTINKELRQQETKSVEVIGGIRNYLGQVAGQLQTIQFILTNRPPAPLPPPDLPT